MYHEFYLHMLGEDINMPSLHIIVSNNFIKVPPSSSLLPVFAWNLVIRDSWLLPHHFLLDLLTWLHHLGKCGPPAVILLKTEEKRTVGAAGQWVSQDSGHPRTVGIPRQWAP